MFRARILAAAEAAGVAVLSVKPADLAAEAAPGAFALVDLEAPGGLDAARTAVSLGARVVGFGSHKDVARLAEARQAGVEAMPRSAFVERLAALVAGA